MQAVKRRIQNLRLHQLKHIFAEFYFNPNSTWTYLVSSKTLLVYKGNPKHVFYIAFQREKSVPLLYLGFCTQKTLSYISWRISRSGVIKVAAFSNHQRYWWSKPSMVFLESQTGEFVCLFFFWLQMWVLVFQSPNK